MLTHVHKLTHTHLHCKPDKETTKAEASLLTKIVRDRLVDSKFDVEVQQHDPNSPLYSVKSFEELRL